MLKIMSGTRYGKNTAFAYSQGVAEGYKQAVNQFKKDLEEEIRRSIDRVYEKLNEAFSVNAVIEKSVIHEYNVDMPLNFNKYLKTTTVSLPTICFRFEIYPELPYFVSCEEERGKE